MSRKILSETDTPDAVVERLFFLLEEFADMKQRHSNKEDFMAEFDTLIKGGTIVDGTRVHGQAS